MWIDEIKVGDILLEHGRSERVVRSVSRSKTGLVCYVGFSIKRCSWTGRCYTIISRADLKARGFVPTGKAYALNSELDREIDLDLKYRDRVAVTCCAVKGVR